MKKRGFLTLASRKSLLWRRLGLSAIVLVAAVFVSGVAFAFDTDGHMGVAGTAEIVFWPEMTWNNTHVDFSAIGEQGEADKTTEEPDRTTEEPNTEIEEPNTEIEQPDETIEEPNGTIEEPNTTIEESDRVTEEPDRAIEEPDSAASDDGGTNEAAADAAATNYEPSSDESS